jgi:UDP-glucose 4-epimerase
MSARGRALVDGFGAARAAEGGVGATRPVKALITGGAGFLGSHLAEALIARGDTVYVLDNLSTGSIENIEHLKTDRRFHYAIDSVMNEPVTAELIDRVDVVFHLAAAVGVRLIVESPVNTIETNVHGTEMVLKLANKKKKKVLVASTSEVYGKSEDVPFREDADIVMGPTSKGRWSYACSKAIDEFLALAYHKEKKLPVVVVAALQHRGPAPDRPLRDGDPELREAGPPRPPHHRVRRRAAEPLLHLRDRRGGALLKLAEHEARWARCSTSATTAKRSPSSTSPSA